MVSFAMMANSLFSSGSALHDRPILRGVILRGVHGAGRDCDVVERLVALLIAGECGG
jgi:hypothetical protein